MQPCVQWPRTLLRMVTQEFQFDRFVLRPHARELLDDGAPVRIGDRAFDLLSALVEARGDVVSRDTLFARAWPGRVVIDDNLKVQVMALRKLLGAEAVATVPRRGYRLGLPLRGCDATRSRAANGQVPAGLIGRDSELAQLQRALSASRLVSLVGPGGIGKTRLANATAESLASRFGDGISVVELASLADARRVPEAVARALRLPAMPGRVDEVALARACTPLAALIVLDNCEHLLGAVSSVVECLLQAAPQVTVLATSQEPLGLHGEQVLRLQGLRCDGPADAIDEAPAVQLFAARARAVDAGFRLDPDSLAAVAEICRHLEGSPLALELAAARVPLLGASGVLERLDHQLKLLTRGSADAPERQQTLRAAMQWSHGLLDATQRTVFRRLAVFADSFTLQGAQAVAGDDAIDEWMVLDALDALVAKSLVQTVHAGASRRVRLLATARAFALERLEESGERGATMRRHAGWVHRVFERAAPLVHDEPLRRWLDALWPEVHDLRAALRWAADNDAELDARAGRFGRLVLGAGATRSRGGAMDCRRSRQRARADAAAVGGALLAGGGAAFGQPGGADRAVARGGAARAGLVRPARRRPRPLPHARAAGAAWPACEPAARRACAARAHARHRTTRLAAAAPHAAHARRGHRDGACRRLARVPRALPPGGGDAGRGRRRDALVGCAVPRGAGRDRVAAAARGHRRDGTGGAAAARGRPVARAVDTARGVVDRAHRSRRGPGSGGSGARRGHAACGWPAHRPGLPTT